MKIREFQLSCQSVDISTNRDGSLHLNLYEIDSTFLDDEISVEDIIQTCGETIFLETIGRAACLLHFEVEDPETQSYVYTGTEA